MIFSTGPIIRAGHILKTHGFEGQLKIECEDDDILNKEEPIFLLMDGRPVPFFLTSISGSNPYVISLDGINHFDQAKPLTGKEIFISGSAEETDDLYLIGYQIKDDRFGDIGEITEQIDNGAQEIVVVNYNGVECMIPLVDAIFTSIDAEHKIAFTHLPDGLLEVFTDSESDESE